jgi:hypothetical protein
MVTFTNKGLDPADGPPRASRQAAGRNGQPLSEPHPSAVKPTSRPGYLTARLPKSAASHLSNLPGSLSTRVPSGPRRQNPLNPPRSIKSPSRKILILANRIEFRQNSITTPGAALRYCNRRTGTEMLFSLPVEDFSRAGAASSRSHSHRTKVWETGQSWARAVGSKRFVDGADPAAPGGRRLIVLQSVNRCLATTPAGRLQPDTNAARVMGYVACSRAAH